MDSIYLQKQAIRKGEKWRITVLTPYLLRLEFSETGSFIDKPTQMAANRHFPVPEFTVKDQPNRLCLTTKGLRLTYDKAAFSPTGLTIEGLGENGETVFLWHYGDTPHDLKGTARTLDGADGAIRLEHGLMSKDGWSVISDQGSTLIEEDGWISQREDKSAEDLYFFGYGRNYIGCLKDFYTLTGSVPLLPRFAMGNWWSRYYRYTQESYLALMDRFDREDIPFTVSVIDMDWHITDVDARYGTGWTGYTWNRDLFPDPQAFLKALHDRGRKVTLNVHPADGVRAYEDCYRPFAAFMGVDTEKGEPVRFRPTDRKFMEGYFRFAHHPMEEDGVDFWWIDWQQGTDCGVDGLDPLWLLNRYHYLDNCRNGNRGLIFSRYAGPGSHIYPVGFSGDTIVSWASLDFQPYFTATASNIGYGWWSHDIGGHMQGIKDDEMALRWLQLGVFSPILRLHSSNSEFNSKEPWQYNALVEGIMKDFLRLRHRLIPYTYTMNRRACAEGEPIIEPMYYRSPYEEAAYTVPNQYYFGTELLVCPLTTPVNKATGTAGFSAWLPQGKWIDFFIGVVYTGGRKLDLYRDLYTVPVLAKAGAIIPMDGRRNTRDCGNPDTLEYRVFAGADGAFSLWEDDGIGNTYDAAHWAETPLSFTWGDTAVFTIHPAKGHTAVLPAMRTSTVRLCGVAPCATAVAAVDGQPLTDVTTIYHTDTACLEIRIPTISIASTITVTVTNARLSDNRVDERIHTFLNRAQLEFDTKAFSMDAVRQRHHGMETAAILKKLQELSLPQEGIGPIKELLTAAE